MSDFEFTENEVLQALDMAGLKHRNQRRYILTQCPTHEDKNPSAQIYKDDWFVNCHAVCGRFPIQQAFPHLSDKSKAPEPPRKKEMQVVSNYKVYDLMDDWKNMPLIPRDHEFKTIPLEILDELGWRWSEEKQSYFIPYWNMSKTQIPFAQWRHLQGERRFTFLKDAKPIVYGLQNLDGNPKIFIVEGASDCAVLDYVSVPWVGLPSASSAELMKKLAGYCKDHAIEMVYAGDNDAAGDKLREALDEAGAHYRVHQPPKDYKDWGDFLVAKGFDEVMEYAQRELFEQTKNPIDPGVQNVLDVFPGAKVLNVVGDDGKNVELEQQKPSSPQVLF